jgi:hypothetical protein
VKNKPELSAYEEQIWIDAILHDRPHIVFGRQITGDVRPGAAAIGAFHDVRLVIAALPVVEGNEDRVHIARRSEDVGDVGVLGHVREVVDATPIIAAIFRDLQQTCGRCAGCQSTGASMSAGSGCTVHPS